MKFIFVKPNHQAIIDDDDFERISSLCWAMSGKYPTHSFWVGGRSKTVRLHQFIIGKKEGFQIDHKNGFPLDNRKQNLRFCTLQDQQRNKSYTNKFGYKGVCKRRDKYLAIISVNKHHKYGKTRQTIKEAAKDYNDLAIKYFGEFACLNVVH